MSQREMDAVVVAEANADEYGKSVESKLENGDDNKAENRFQKAIAAWRSELHIPRGQSTKLNNFRCRTCQSHLPA